MQKNILLFCALMGAFVLQASHPEKNNWINDAEVGVGAAIGEASKKFIVTITDKDYQECVALLHANVIPILVAAMQSTLAVIHNKLIYCKSI